MWRGAQRDYSLIMWKGHRAGRHVLEQTLYKEQDETCSNTPRCIGVFRIRQGPRLISVCDSNSFDGEEEWGRVTSQGVNLDQTECKHLHHQQQGKNSPVAANLCTGVDICCRYLVKTNLRYL